MISSLVKEDRVESSEAVAMVTGEEPEPTDSQPAAVILQVHMEGSKTAAQVTHTERLHSINYY